MAEISQERLMAFVRDYTNTMNRDNDLGERVIRELNSSAKRIGTITYRTEFGAGKSGIQFKLNARNQLTVLGATARKREMLDALRILRQNREASTEPRTEEDERTDATITRLIDTLNTAITRTESREEAARNELDELRSRFEEMVGESISRQNGTAENTEEVSYSLNSRRVQFVMDDRGQIRVEGTINNRQVAANKLRSIINEDGISAEARAIAQTIIDRINQDIENEKSARDAAEDARLARELEAEGTPEYARYRELHETIQRIGDVDRNTSNEDKYRLEAFGIRANSRTVRQNEETIQSELSNAVRFRYNRDGDLRTYGGTQIGKKRMVLRLQTILTFDELTDEDRDTVNKLLAALNRSLRRDTREPINPTAEPTPDPTREPTQEPTYRDVEIIRKPLIQERIDYYRGLEAQNNPDQRDPEEVRRLQEILNQREEIRNLRTQIALAEGQIEQIEENELTGDAQEQAGPRQAIADLQNQISEYESRLSGFPEDLSYTRNEIIDRLEALRRDPENADPALIARLEDLLNSYNYQLELINAQRERRAQLETSIRSHEAVIEELEADNSGDAQEQANRNAEIERYRSDIEGWQAELSTLPEDLRLTEEEIRNALENYDNNPVLRNNQYLTRDRLEVLLNSYTYQREAQVVNTPDSISHRAVIDELEDLIHTTPDNVPYVYAEEANRRLEEYRRERDELLARRDNGEGQIDNTAEINRIRLRMAEILGRNPLEGIENENEHAIPYELDDNEIDEFQELRTELEGLTPQDETRRREIRLRMAQILRIDPYENLEGIENENEHAIPNQLDDNEIDEFQELRAELARLREQQNEQRTGLTPEEEQRLQNINLIIEELEGLLRQRETIREQVDPTIDPTPDPTKDPTVDPTKDPTVDPTKDPTVDPTKDPTVDPTKDPTVDPTKDPTVDPTKDPTVDPTKDPTPDPTVDPTQPPLVTKGFWRLVQETSHHEGDQVGSFAITVRQFAHAPLGPTRIRDGGIGIVLGLPTAILSLPIKLAAKIGNRFTGAEDKFEEMLANINALPQDQFDFLVAGMREDVMRKNKINDLYLEAILTRLRTEGQDKIAHSDQTRANAREIMNRENGIMDQMVQDMIQRSGLSRDQVMLILADRSVIRNPQTLADIDNAENALIATGEYTRSDMEQARLEYQGHRVLRNRNSELEMSSDEEMEETVVRQVKAFERGKVGKSFQKMNYGPTFPILKYFTRFNPNNREMIEQLADHEDAAIQARRDGDIETARDHEFEMRRVREENTHEVHFGPFTISRGNAHHEEVTVIPDDRDDTRGRQMMSNIMIVVAGYNFFKTISDNAKAVAAEQQRLDSQIQQHNTDIGSVNANNLQVEQDYQAALAQIQQQVQSGQAPDMHTFEAVQTIIKGNSQGLLGRYHDAFTTSSNQVAGGFWDFAKDAQVHSDLQQLNTLVEQTCQQAEALARSGDYTGGIQMLLDLNAQHVDPAMVDAIKYEIGVWQQAVQSGSQYSNMYQSSIDAANSFLTNRGNIQDLLRNTAQQVTVPTVSGTIMSAQPMQGFHITVPSTWAPSVAMLATTVGNSLFGKLRRDRIRMNANTQNPAQDQEQDQEQDGEDR